MSIKWTIPDKCPKCGSLKMKWADRYSVYDFACGTKLYNDGSPRSEGKSCLKLQRDQLRAALANLMPIIDSELDQFNPIVKEAKKLVEIK